MSNYDQIASLFNKQEKLEAVLYSIYDAASSGGRDCIAAIQLSFDNGTIATISINTELDNLMIGLHPMAIDQDCYVVDASHTVFWDKMLGRTLSWIWLLTNQQGYQDGIRFEFCARPEDEEKMIVTLIGIASRIEVFSSAEVVLKFDERANGKVLNP